MVLRPEFVELMRGLLQAQTRDAITDTFGISANTWNKIKAGHAIRASVAKRLLDRLDRLTRQSS